MSAPCSEACSPWAVLADAQGCSSCEDIDPDLLENQIAVASDLLFRLSGRQFPGSCRDTVRPMPSCKCHSPTVPGHPYYRGKCDCVPQRVALGGFPVTSIEEVLTHGNVMDPSLYVVHDFRWLVPQRDSEGALTRFPCCQDLSVPTTEEGTFQVTYTYGVGPPASGVAAAAALACQFALACTGSEECVLPANVSSLTRQGVSIAMIVPGDSIERVKSAIPAVGLFLSAYNPSGVSGRSGILTPEMMAGAPVRETS